MSARLQLLRSFVVCLGLLFAGSGQAQNCHNIDPAANQPLRSVTLPPSPPNNCSIRLNTGFPEPDPACTPGAINPGVTEEILRDSQFRENCSANRRITASEKEQTFTWYAIAPPKNNTASNQTCALDYLIPLELGGADSLENIWPLCGPPGAPLTHRYFREKILVNHYLVAEVRSGGMDLADAQDGIVTDWSQYIDYALAFARSNKLPRHHHYYVSPNRLPVHTENDPRVVRLLMASTRVIQRMPQPTNGLELISTDQRSQTLSFGAALVRVPDKHVAGTVERPFCLCLFGLTLYKQPQNQVKHFILRSTVWLSQDDFIAEVSNSNNHQVLVFVHGFNTTLEDGLFRLGQIVFDGKFQGVPILFSWPSKGGAADYASDGDGAQYSLDGFRQLMKLLQDDPDVSAIHVVAHSMGNRIVLGSLEDHPLQPNSLGQLVLAAPDVDRDVFTIEEPKIAGFRGVTLYASSKDWALRLSEKLHSDFARAGDVPTPPSTPIVLPPMDTIDASLLGSDLLGLNHDTFAASAALCDIGRLLRDGTKPPNIRTPAIQAYPGPPSYWKYVTADNTWKPNTGCQ